MPELPEVETVVRELQGVLLGQKVKRVEVLRENILGGLAPEDFAGAVEGARFKSIKRRGKYLLFGLAGVPMEFLLAHLRMTGKFVWCQNPSTQQKTQQETQQETQQKTEQKLEQKHDRVRFQMESGGMLIFQDMRCFGRLQLGSIEQDFVALARLGIEPFAKSFTVGWLVKELNKSGSSLKSFLLDQSKVVGLGNIYVCEACFRARVSPLRVANSLQDREVKRLHREIKQVLTEAIAKNGTTISDFKRVDNKSGEFQNFLQVYGRAGYACKVCEGKVLKIRQQQRSTFYCPNCQPILAQSKGQC